MIRKKSFIVLLGLFISFISYENAVKADSLSKAIRKSDLAKVEKLVNQGASVNGEESQTSPLGLAATCGDLKIVTFLVAKGANINHRNSYGETPLMLAEQNGHLDVVAFLKSKGARTNFGKIHEASASNSIDVVLQLLADGIDVNERRPSDDFTPLHVAVETGSKDVVNLLISKGADLKATSSHGFGTPLHVAIRRFITSESSDMVELLLSRGADVNAKASDGSTPLHYSASNPLSYQFNTGTVSLFAVKEVHKRYLITVDKCHKAIELLLAKGADINAKDVDGKTPLDWARREGQDEIETFLKSKGAKSGKQMK